MLLRKHVHKLLSTYYQQPHSDVVGSIQSSPVNFQKILGKWHWQYIHNKLYKNQEGQWLTPVELFKPHYSRVLGNFVASEADKFKEKSDYERVQILEIGGGRGTNATLILDQLQNAHPQIYEQVESYTIMDASPTLLDLMKKVLIDGSINAKSNDQSSITNRHADKIRLKQLDMMDIAEKRSNNVLEKSNTPTIILAMEVLDNLPHDKLAICKTTGNVLQTEIIQENNSAYASNTNDAVFQEVFNPLTDELIQEIVSLQPSYIPSSIPKWIPTVACGLLKEILFTHPNSSVVFADFDWLPPPKIESKSTQTRRSLLGINEPLVTSMDDIDHVCYLTAPPLCDILFPTDFQALSIYCERLLSDSAADVNVHFMKQNEFLLMYGPNEVNHTRNWFGYTPLLEDFTNCSVLCVSR